MILNKRYLREQAEIRNISQDDISKERIITENTELLHSYDSIKEREYDIFLSHSFLDKQLVLVLVNLFNEAGYSVYVDWIEDSHLDRNNVDKNTADILRNRMNDSRGLAYIATSNITNSKWCPWELGYFDGKKEGRCCILPIMEERTFVGQEYLGLYPYIEYAKIKGTEQYDFWVYNQGTREYVRLEKWLDGCEPYRY